MSRRTPISDPCTHQGIGWNLHDPVDGEAKVDVASPPIGVEGQTVVAEGVDKPGPSIMKLFTTVIYEIS